MLSATNLRNQHFRSMENEQCCLPTSPKTHHKIHLFAAELYYFCWEKFQKALLKSSFPVFLLLGAANN